MIVGERAKEVWSREGEVREDGVRGGGSGTLAKSLTLLAIWERESVCVSERERESVCVSERERERVCVSERERERESVSERDRESVYHTH